MGYITIDRYLERCRERYGEELTPPRRTVERWVTSGRVKPFPSPDPEFTGAIRPAFLPEHELDDCLEDYFEHRESGYGQGWRGTKKGVS